MKFLKKDKRPLIPDYIEVQKDGSQEYQKEKTDKPRTETAIVKKYFITALKKAFGGHRRHYSKSRKSSTS